MSEFLLTHGSRLYTFDFLGLIVVVSLLEFFVPRRPAAGPPGLRWFGNFTLGILSAIVFRLISPVVGIGFASLCAKRGWGLLNHFSLPWWLAAVLTVVALDLAIYAFHYLSHHVSFLWRLHRLHHTDVDVDFTTAVRIHPLDEILGGGIEIGVIALLGAPPAAVLLAQLLFVFSEFVTHANVKLTESLERWIRLFIITPDMHRIHHSQSFRESHSNLGNFFPWWDRCLGTYRHQPAGGHERMRLGLSEFCDPKHQTLPWMLAQPFLEAKPAVDVPAPAG